MAISDVLELWIRRGCALYVEALMGELDFPADPGAMMGLLNSERLKAARIVVDIGLYLGKQVPEDRPVWDAKYAWEFLRRDMAMNEGFLHF